MLTGPRCCQLCPGKLGCQSRPWSRGTLWTPPPGTLQGGLLWAEQGMGQVERGWGVYFSCCHPARRCRELLSTGTGVGTCESVREPGCEKETHGLQGDREPRGCGLGGGCPQREAVGGCRRAGFSEHMPRGVLGKCTCVHGGLRVHVAGVYTCAVREHAHLHMGLGVCTPHQSAQRGLTLPGNAIAMPEHGAEQVPGASPTQGGGICGCLTHPTPNQHPW